MMNTFKKLFRKQINNYLKTNFSSSKSSCDVIISGGGPVGCLIGCALSNSAYFSVPKSQKKRIVLIDQQNLPTMNEVKANKIPDHRVVSLSKKSREVLEAVGSWQYAATQRIGDVKHMQVWEKEGEGYLRFGAGQELSTVIEINNVVAMLHQKIKELGNCEIITQDEIISYQKNQDTGLLDVQLKSGKIIETQLIVGSEGRNSKIKQLAGLSSYGWNYNQMGLVCTIKVKDHQSTAWQRYLPAGPLALLPLYDNYCSIVWTVDIEGYDYLLKLPENEFLNELNNALTSAPDSKTPKFNFFAGSSNFNSDSNFSFPPSVVEICNKRLGFPLVTLQSRRYIAEGVALIGDAAHSIHPQAGQGLNMGFLDAVLLSNTIICNIRTGNNLGQLISLQQYETDAKLLNYSTAFSMEMLKTSYEIQNPILSFARNVAVNMINHVQPLKSAMVNIANNHPLSPKTYEWQKRD